MGCDITFAFPITDMPLDNAIYVTNRDKIFAVRGGYIFVFDSSGTKLTEARFASPSFGESDLCYNPFDDQIYTTFWNQSLNDGGGTPYTTDRGFYRINPDTLTATYIDIRSITPPYPGTHPLSDYRIIECWAGPRRIVCDSAGNLYGTLGFAGGIYWWKVDPYNLPAVKYGDWNFGANGTDNANDLFLDEGAGNLWTTGNGGGDVYIESYLMTTMHNNGNTGAVNNYPTYGIAKANNFIYATTRTQYLVKCQMFSGGTVTYIDLLDANATPYRIRFNAADGLLYIPTLKGDTVIVFDPSTDTIFDTKTGFDSPWSVVFTPTKQFAVQLGGVGLKEII